MNFTAKRDDIGFITGMGFPILEIEVDGKSTYFFTNNFEAPNLSNIQSSPYLTFKGIDITHFIENSIYNMGSEALYGERFAKQIEKGRKIGYKFSDKHIWRFFS